MGSHTEIELLTLNKSTDQHLFLIKSLFCSRCSTLLLWVVKSKHFVSFWKVKLFFLHLCNFEPTNIDIHVALLYTNIYISYVVQLISICCTHECTPMISIDKVGLLHIRSREHGPIQCNRNFSIV